MSQSIFARSRIGRAEGNLVGEILSDTFLLRMKDMKNLKFGGNGLRLFDPLTMFENEGKKVDVDLARR
jgi:hypothetical protein